MNPPSPGAVGKPALVGLAHGSRDPRFAATVSELLNEVRHLRPGLDARPAYLELSEPDLLTACSGMHTGSPVVVVPLLFAPAYHARIDVPQTVAAAREATGFDMQITGILGLGKDLVPLLAASAQRAGITDDQDVVVIAVGSSRRSANDAVTAVVDRWAASRAGGTEVGFATCAPRANDLLAAARSAGRTPALVPLFLGPGLLLDEVLGSAAASGLTAAAPLGASLAPLVLARYDATGAPKAVSSDVSHGSH